MAFHRRDTVTASPFFEVLKTSCWPLRPHPGAMHSFIG